MMDAENADIVLRDGHNYAIRIQKCMDRAKGMVVIPLHAGGGIHFVPLPDDLTFMTGAAISCGTGKPMVH